MPQRFRQDLSQARDGKLTGRGGATQQLGDAARRRLATPRPTPATPTAPLPVTRGLRSVTGGGLEAPGTGVPGGVGEAPGIESAIRNIRMQLGENVQDGDTGEMGDGSAATLPTTISLANQMRGAGFPRPGMAKPMPTYGGTAAQPQQPPANPFLDLLRQRLGSAGAGAGGLGGQYAY